MRRKLGRVFLAGWLAAGAAGVGAEDDYSAVERAHWSFQPMVHSPPPVFSGAQDRDWVRNEVDAFILARLNEEGLRPAPEADRPTLIRRLSFDLTGLPPTPDEVDRFVDDSSPAAYEALVDRLLASPQYGERWARHWLDVVRYAETEGFEYDQLMNGAWRYRDYVIDAFNADKPYDQFVREQMAGDEFAAGDQTLLVAAGFQRLGAVRRNAGNQEVAGSRNEVLTEMTNSLGAVFLGLTIGCARCHDHKFDPIRQVDYYRLQAFFAAAQEHNLLLASAEQQAAWQARNDAAQSEIKRLKSEMAKAAAAGRGALEAQVREAEKNLPPPLPAVCTVENNPEKRTQVHLLARGNWDQPGSVVGMRVPGVLLPAGEPELSADASQPRSRLAGWLTRPENPLTARVLVNRLWLYHFGEGIVATANDFGVNGDPPSHPELLDYLARRLVAEGWRLKPLHRLLVLSSTYRQSSRSPDMAELRRRDPGNRLLARANRRRLEAEELRDAMLAAAGCLNPMAGGPSVVVPVDDDLVNLLYKPSQWQLTADAGEHFRRSIYLLAKRNLRLPFMEVFDQPDSQTSCPRREASTHAPQALELLNGRLSNELASALAERLAREAGPGAVKQVELAFRLTAGRRPTEKESALALEFLRGQPLREFALAMLNLNAFLYVD